MGLHAGDGTGFYTVSMVGKALLDTASLSSSSFGLPESFYLKGRSKKPLSPVSKEIRIKKLLEILLKFETAFFLQLSKSWLLLILFMVQKRMKNPGALYLYTGSKPQNLGMLYCYLCLSYSYLKVVLNIKYHNLEAQKK